MSNSKIKQVMDTAKKYVHGQDELLLHILGSICCGGHLLIEGPPGTGKTLSVAVVSKLCDLEFRRIQFTPDLLPSDVLGTQIFVPGESSFKIKKGPIFTQILLADEINRTPPKVQSALLEAMEEKQVTIGEQSHQLSFPFVVLATQNPIEHEGTYPLPEAQVDRFQVKVEMRYPNFAEERKILDLKGRKFEEVAAVLKAQEIETISKEIETVYVDEKIKDLIIKIIQATRPDSDNFLMDYQGYIRYGASPRAGVWLQRVARFMAYYEGKDFVHPDHIRKILPEVLGHRILLSYEARMNGIKGRDIISKIFEYVL
ncbi:MAG: AAA family ATPase [Oligoflexia bacterium]|nr:AAA family ATPase [Oligoflexia bacterium]